MKDKLRKVLADDMNVYRYTYETECEYNQRLIYSAGSAWAKALVYGHSYSDIKSNENYVNTDIMYVETHLSKVLEAYLNCFDIKDDWLETDRADNVDEKARALAGHIVKELLYTYNLAQIHSRKLSPLKTQYFKYGKELFLVRGERQFSKTTYSVGVAQWIKESDIKEYKVHRKIVDVKGEDYYQIMNSEFTWKNTDLKSEYLKFETGSKGAYSKCWKPANLDDITQQISILKLANEYNGGYLLVKRYNNELLIAELDPWYIEEREIYRILYALNYKNNTPAEFQANKKEDYYILRFSGAIPKYEDRIIRCCSWPYKTYSDKYSKIVPGFLWSIVENIISDLGIKIIYQ
ncbi:MAG: hypothetical protein GX660_12090 [Clostridiaceae bacterium]|nr:hypothetical protein [Clostridiaceae bacterium]